MAKSKSQHAGAKEGSGRKPVAIDYFRKAQAAKGRRRWEVVVTDEEREWLKQDLEQFRQHKEAFGRLIRDAQEQKMGYE